MNRQYTISAKYTLALILISVTSIFANDPAAEVSTATSPSTAGKSISIYSSFDEMVKDSDPILHPIRTVTSGPKFHWFGYYDKDQLDPSGRYLLTMEVDFEHRLPTADDAVNIGMIDLADGDKWIKLGKSYAWSWQQGCMLQWRPGSDREILWNDREKNRFVCRIFNVKKRKMRTIPMPIEHISPDGKYAVSGDFSRIWDIRAGYGYPGIPDIYAARKAPSELGVWQINLQTGETNMLVSVADLIKVPYDHPMPNHKHYINHLAWSPDGKRILMFHRWIGSGGQPTRVFTIGADGQDLRLLSAHGASHWTWRDPENVLIWAEGGYRLYKDDGSGEPKETVWTALNGHQTYVPGTDNQWLVTDTYPYGPNREQFLYMYHIPTASFVLLGRFAMPKEYRGEWRCDLHPRVSRDGQFVIIDSPHGGNGRQLHMLNIKQVIAQSLPHK